MPEGRGGGPAQHDLCHRLNQSGHFNPLVMSTTNVIGVIAALPQLAVVYFALRLNRRYGSARVGWQLVASFALLAILYLLFFSEPLQTYPRMEIKMDIAYALTSLFLLGIMISLGLVQKERDRTRMVESRAQIELEARVELQTRELIAANEELKLTASSLRTQVEQRKRMQEQMEKTHRELLTVTRQAAMSEVATGVLHNVGNVLNSVNVSACLLADHLRNSKL